MVVDRLDDMAQPKFNQGPSRARPAREKRRHLYCHSLVLLLVLSYRLPRWSMRALLRVERFDPSRGGEANGRVEETDVSIIVARWSLHGGRGHDEDTVGLTALPNQTGPYRRVWFYTQPREELLPFCKADCHRLSKSICAVIERSLVRRSMRDRTER